MVHGHPQKQGSLTDKPAGTVIKCFDSEEEAESMHKAIIISQAKQAKPVNLIAMLREKAKIQSRGPDGRFYNSVSTSKEPKIVDIKGMKRPEITDVKSFAKSLPKNIKEEFRGKTGSNPDKKKVKSVLKEMIKANGTGFLPVNLKNRYQLIRKNIMSKTKDEKQADEAAVEDLANTISPMSARIGFRAVQSDVSGKKWEAVIIANGISKANPKRYMWSPELLKENVAVFQGIPVNYYEVPGHYLSHLQANDNIVEDLKNYMISNNIGTVEKAWFDESRGICGVINFHDIKKANQMANHELSIDSRISGYTGEYEGKACIYPTKINNVSSLDVVTRAAAGGQFLRAVAGMDKNKGVFMEKEQILAMIKNARPDLLEGKDTEKMTDQEISEMARQAMELPAKEEKTADEPAVVNTGITAEQLETILAKQAQPAPAFDMNSVLAVIKETAQKHLNTDSITTEIKKVTDSMEEKAACARLLATSLIDSGLPDVIKNRIKPVFDNRVFQAAELENTIKEELEILAALEVPSFNLPDQSRVQMGISGVEKLQVALDKTFGITKENLEQGKTKRNLKGERVFQGIRVGQSAIDAYDDIDPFPGIRAAYTAYTGDTDVTGFVNPKNIVSELRAAQDITTGTWTYALGNTLYRRLINMYNQTNFHEDMLISERKPVRDFRIQEAVKTGYIDNLPEVAETAGYGTLTEFTDEKAQYKIKKFGGIMPVSQETIINDDLGMVRRMVDAMGRAGKRTYAEFVWDFFISNGTVTDGTAWFTAPHGNLGATALSFATAITAYQALANMTELDSGKKIGLLDDPNNKPVLVYPIDLGPTGHQIVNQETYYTTDDMTTKILNYLHGRIDGIQVSLLTDANDWGLLLNPNYVSMVEMGFLNGNQEPQILIADNPTSGSLFQRDVIEYKIKQIYGGTATDYVGGYKAVVA